MIPSRSKHSVFFDFFGTLLIYGDMKAAWSAWLSSLHTCLQAEGLSMSREELAAACEGLFGLPEPPEDGRGHTVFERRLDRLADELGLGLSTEAIRSTATTCVRAWQAYVTPDPEAESVLRELSSRMPLALVSNFDHPPHARELLSGVGYERYFAMVVISAEVGFKKPDPRIFEPALAVTGLDPQDVLYVGDSEEDVAAARAAGMQPVRIVRDRPENSRVVTDFTTDWESQDTTLTDSDGTTVIRSLRELLPMVIG